MSEKDVEVLPKKSVKAFRFLGSFIFFVVGFFIISNGSSFDLQSLRILTSVVGGLTMLSSLLWIPHTLKFRINFGPDCIKQTGLLTKEIPYQNIEKLIVRKGFVEICGNSLFNRISIGDLYSNFSSATDILASKIKEGDKITLAGQKKYIDKYFNASPN